MHTQITRVCFLWLNSNSRFIQIRREKPRNILYNKLSNMSQSFVIQVLQVRELVSSGNQWLVSLISCFGSRNSFSFLRLCKFVLEQELHRVYMTEAARFHQLLLCWRTLVRHLGLLCGSAYGFRLLLEVRFVGGILSKSVLLKNIILNSLPRFPNT